MKLNRFITPVICAICLIITACGNDEPQIPVNAITLNLMNRDNGGTTVGGSDVYIDGANNFVSSSCGIVDLGRKGNLNQNPNLTQVAQEIAVTPGNFYQIIPARDIRKIADARAFPLTGNYYNLYVDSWIYDSDKAISGAKIRYAECTPSTDKLPEWDTTYPVYLKSHSDIYVEEATFSFGKNVRIDSDYDVYGIYDSNLSSCLDIKITDNKIEFSNSSYTPGGKAEVVFNVRYESLYTRVHFIVSSSI